MPNFIEIAERYNAHKIDSTDSDYIKAEKALMELASTEEGKQELASIVYTYIRRWQSEFDISPYIFQNKTFKPTDKPVFREKGHGIKAYWIAPNSATPKSRNFDNEFTMEFETVSVSPECHLDDLTYGRIASFAELLQDAKDAVKIAICEKVYTLLGQTYNVSTNSDNYATCTTTVTENALKTAVKKIRKRAKGGDVTILCSIDTASEIGDFTGYVAMASENAKEELRKEGLVGTYNGCKVVAVAETTDGNGNVVVPDNFVYVISNKIGFSGDMDTGRVGQNTNIDDWSWYAKIDIEKGWVVTHPEYLYRIEIV